MSFENAYYRWVMCEPNKMGMLYYRQDKATGEWRIFHATLCSWPVPGRVCMRC